MAGFRGSGSWIPEVAACTLLIRYTRENFKIATFSHLSGIRLWFMEGRLAADLTGRGHPSQIGREGLNGCVHNGKKC